MIKKHEIIPYKKISLKSSSHLKINNKNLMSTDNEELIAQIYYSKKEIQQKMREINELKSKFNLLEEDNKTNKLLMEKLLYRDEEPIKNANTNQNENEEGQENNENIPTKITKDESKKIQLLKNEIKHYEKSLSEIEKKIALKKEEEMTQKYIFLSDQIKSKDAELKDLFNSCTELNIQLNDLYDQKINLEVKKKKIVDENKKTAEKIKEYEKSIENINKDIEECKAERDRLKKRKNEEEEKEKLLENEQNKNKEKEEKIKKELKDNENLIKEK